MATFTSTTVGNIFDVMKMKLPNGSAVDSVVNALAKRDDFTRFVPAFPANNGLSHHGVRTVTLPTGYKVDIGGSWKASKSEHEPFVEALMTVRSAYEAPVDTFQQEKQEVGEKLLQANRTAHIMGLNQAVMNEILGGGTDQTGTTPIASQGGLVGLMDRDPYKTYDNKFTFNVGGSNDLRSCWLIKPGIDTVHTLYNPNHPTLGIEEEYMGKLRADNLGTSDDEHNYYICYEYLITKGLAIRDQRAVKRICNVDCGIGDLPGAALINAIIEASIINAPTGGQMSVTAANGQVDELESNWILLCPERLYAKLVIEANNKLMVYMSDENIYRTRLPMIGPDIVIARFDALNKLIGSGEAAVVAA